MAMTGEFARWHTEAIEVRHHLCTWQLSLQDSDGRNVVMARGSEPTFQEANHQAGLTYRAMRKAWLRH